MTQPSAGTHFPCPSCGAPEMAFDPATQQMRCPFCGHAQPVEPAGGTESPPEGAGGSGSAVGPQEERALRDGLRQQAEATGDGYGTPVRTLRCETCGATVSFAGTDLSKTCDFCGSQHVLEQEAHRRVIRPQSLVPFAVDEPKAKASFADWLGGLWFRPSDLKAKAKVGAIAGVYIPYWTFDARVESEWRAEAGHYYYEQESYVESGEKKTRQVRKTRWEPAYGRREDRYDDLLVVASQGLPRPIAQRMSTFDTERLIPYDPRYLAGWRAEEYAVELSAAWREAALEMEQGQRSRCAEDIPGDTYRSLQVQNEYGDESFKHVLLPLWIASYRYGDEPYQFLVNGQTGEVQGEAPISWLKVTLFVLLIVAVIAGIVLAAKGLG